MVRPSSHSWERTLSESDLRGLAPQLQCRLSCWVRKGIPTGMGEQKLERVGVTPGGAEAGRIPEREAAVIHRLPAQAPAPMIQTPSYCLLCIPLP